MADDFSYPIPAGSTFAADEVDGRKFQRVKLTYGVDGTADDVQAGLPLPVDLPKVRAQASAAATASSDVLLVRPVDAAGAVIEGGSSGGGGGGGVTALKPPPSTNAVNVAQNFSNSSTTGTSILSARAAAYTVITGYSLSALFADSTTPETWKVELGMQISGTFTAFASALVRGQAGRIEYSGGFYAPAARLSTANQGLYIRCQRLEGTVNTQVYLAGHVAYYYLSVDDNIGPL
jgi:hypothetical protein